MKNKKITLAVLRRRQGFRWVAEACGLKQAPGEPVSCVTILPPNRPVVFKAKHPFLADVEVVFGEDPGIDITPR